jgi:hypothetical protein
MMEEEFVFRFVGRRCRIYALGILSRLKSDWRTVAPRVWPGWIRPKEEMYATTGCCPPGFRGGGSGDSAGVGAGSLFGDYSRSWGTHFQQKVAPPERNVYLVVRLRGVCSGEPKRRARCHVGCTGPMGVHYSHTRHSGPARYSPECPLVTKWHR